MDGGGNLNTTKMRFNSTYRKIIMSSTLSREETNKFED